MNGTDYTISYSNNENIGTATVTVTGKGNYSNKATIIYDWTPNEKFYLTYIFSVVLCCACKERDTMTTLENFYFGNVNPSEYKQSKDTKMKLSEMTGFKLGVKMTTEIYADKQQRWDRKSLTAASHIMNACTGILSSAVKTGSMIQNAAQKICEHLWKEYSSCSQSMCCVIVWKIFVLILHRNYTCSKSILSYKLRV